MLERGGKRRDRRGECRGSARPAGVVFDPRAGFTDALRVSGAFRFFGR